MRDSFQSPSQTAFPVWFLGTFAVVFLGAGAVNYAVDPGRLFGKGAEAQVAKELLSGHHLVDPGNFDDRLLRKEIIERESTIPHTIVLGSSRALNLRAADIDVTRNTFFNHSVGCAVLEDILGVTQLFRDKGRMPARIVVGVDPWLFNRGLKRDAWRSLAPEKSRMVADLGENLTELTVEPLRTKDLFTLTYTWLSIQSALSGRDASTLRPVPASTMPREVTMFSDGSRNFGLDAEETPTLGLDPVKRGRQIGVGQIFGLEGFDRVDAERIRVFERWILQMRKQGVEVTLFLIPFAPVTYQTVAANPLYRPVVETERTLRAFSSRQGLELRGSYDPAAAGCRGADFIDVLHAKPACLRRAWALLSAPQS